MKTTIFCTLLMAISAAAFAQEKPAAAFVDFDAYEALVKQVKLHRAERLLLLEPFLAKAKEPYTLILDTRSKDMYDQKHIAGAVHLNFSDFTQASLDSLMAAYAGKATQIL
ncbi:MAG: rhodanese-like domain-containing protein, partial [Sphingobacteriales bacterium]